MLEVKLLQTEKEEILGVNLDDLLISQPDTGEQALEMAGNMSLEARGPGNIFYSEGEVKVFEDEIAFKLSEFPVLLNPSGSLSGKWTYVPTQILGLKNGRQDLAALNGLGKNLVYQGEETIGSDRTWHFSGTLSDEISQQMQAAWQVDSSGNKGLDVVARLLQANKVKQVEVWVAKKDSQLRRIKVNFVRPLKNGNEFDFATLDVTLSDYGRVAVVERPVKELTVRPDVFAKIFGTGEIQEIKTE